MKKFLVICNILSLAAILDAATYRWVGLGADENWSTSNNWNPATNPATDSSALVFINDYTSNGIANHTTSDGNTTLSGGIYLGRGATSGIGAFNMKGGSLQTNRFNIGNAGESAGIFSIYGGNLTLVANPEHPQNDTAYFRMETANSQFNFFGGTITVDSYIRFTGTNTINMYNVGTYSPAEGATYAPIYAKNLYNQVRGIQTGTGGTTINISLAPNISGSEGDVFYLMEYCGSNGAFSFTNASNNSEILINGFRFRFRTDLSVNGHLAIGIIALEDFSTSPKKGTLILFSAVNALSN